jgi:putative colanic acid biosynthesis acetyltransferase WcaF
MNQGVKPINLLQAGNRDYLPGRPQWFIVIWILFEFLFVSNPLQLSSRLRAAVLRLFGARIGKHVVMRPRIRVKYPWHLEVGERSWIGESVWLHNQVLLSIGSDTVISQDSFITTGSHDWQQTMELVVKPVSIGNGVWLNARCMVLQGVEIGDNALVLPGSVVNRSLPAQSICGGVPARFLRLREPPQAG